MTHLTRDELERWRDRGAAGDRDRVLAHLAACEPCRKQYAELVRLPPAPPSRFDPREFVARGRDAYRESRLAWWRHPAVWIAAPAVAAAVVVLALLVPRQPPLVERPAGVRSTELAAEAPVGEVRAAGAFKWSSPFAAARYRLVVRDATGATVFTGSAAAEQLTLPAETAARLTPGRYTWAVEAIDASGSVIAASQLQSFTIVP